MNEAFFCLKCRVFIKLIAPLYFWVTFMVIAPLGAALAQEQGPATHNKSFIEEFIKTAIVFPNFADGKAYRFSEKDMPQFAELLTKKHPWLSNVMLPEKRFPKLGVVNKWNHGIAVSLEAGEVFPEIAASEKSLDKLFYINGSDVTIPFSKEGGVEIIRDQIRKVGAEIANATHLTFTLHDQSEDGAVASEKSNLRIVLVPNPKKNAAVYKPINHAMAADAYSGARLWYFDGMVYKNVPQAIYYASNEDYHIYGYFFPNEDNIIQNAFCYIWDGHEETVLRSLVNECLVRSMGLPGLGSSTQEGFLGNWYNVTTGKVFVDPQKGLTRFDIEMLKTLYSQNIKAGMDILEVYRVMISKH